MEISKERKEELLETHLLNYEMPEGKMTRLRASLVCEGTLARDAKEINLGEENLCGR